MRGIALSIVLWATILAPLPLAAQQPTATVTGMVRDSAGRALAAVEVHALDPLTGFSYRAFTASTGRYWLQALPPASYEITARRVGLRATTVRNVELAVGRRISVDFTLRPSAVALEPLTVEAEPSQIETTRSEVAYVLDRREIAQLPEESRNFIELARLVPGATAGAVGLGAPPSFGTRGSIVGALNQQSLGVLVDGGDLTEPFFGELGGAVPLLAIREFEVVQSQYSAAFGRAASGVVNVVTRRGSNAFQVEGFALYRDRALNAMGAFETKKPDFNRRHWGIAAGGPIVADRTHFFTAFERRVQNDYATVNTSGAFPSYEGTFRTPHTDNLMFARIDHRAGDAHELTLRYAGEVGEQLIGVGGKSALEHGTNNSIAMHSGLLTDRWSPVRGWLNEARLHVISTRRILDRNGTGPTLIYPDLQAGPIRMHGSLRDIRVELRDDFSRIVAGRTGSHRLRFGTQLSWQNNHQENYFFDNGLFQFLADTASEPAFAMATFANEAIRLDARNLQIGVYAEDSWNPTPSLTLNVGLRYDIETNGSNQGFVSPYAGQLPFISTSSRPIDNNNLAPRLGVAWDPGGDGRTVVRSGFGIFYDALVATPLLALERSAGIGTARIRNPGTTALADLMVDPDTLPPTIWTEGDIRTPMTRQFSLGLERALPAGVVFRIDGVLIQGQNLLLQRDLNPVDPVTGPRYPGFAAVRQIVTAGHATAKMLVLEARKRFPHGWLTIGYTLADRHNTNDAWGGALVPQTDLDSLNLDEEWGPAAWDERHRLVATGSIAVPVGLHVTWKVVYASTRPFTAITGANDNGDADPSNDRFAGEPRNARRGPDYFRTDLGVTWGWPAWGGSHAALALNVYNLFNTTNGMPSSVQNVIGSDAFGQALAAFPKRQVELGIQLGWPRGAQ